MQRNPRPRAPRRRVVDAMAMFGRLPGGGHGMTGQWRYLLSCDHQTYGRSAIAVGTTRACRQCGEEGKGNG